MKLNFDHTNVNKAECWQPGTGLHIVVSAVITALRERCRNVKAPVEKQENTSNLVTQTEADLKAELKSRETLFRLVEKGMITDEEFAERRKLSKERASSIEEKIARARAATQSAARRRSLEVNLKRAIDELRDYRGRAQEVNDFLKTFVDRKEYEKDPETGKIRLRVLFK